MLSRPTEGPPLVSSSRGAAKACHPGEVLYSLRRLHRRMVRRRVAPVGRAESSRLNGKRHAPESPIRERVDPLPALPRGLADSNHPTFKWNSKETLLGRIRG
jgi:hypothetical protein